MSGSEPRGAIFYWTSFRYDPLRTNISSSLVTPPVMGHASHMPPPDPGDASQAAWSVFPAHGAPMRPSAHATGSQVDRAGFLERRVTAPTSGKPSRVTPLL